MINNGVVLQRIKRVFTLLFKGRSDTDTENTKFTHSKNNVVVYLYL